MNSPARFVFWLLGFALIVFVAVIALYPIWNLTVPEPVTKHLDALIVAFVGMLATVNHQAPPAGGDGK